MALGAVFRGANGMGGKRPGAFVSGSNGRGQMELTDAKRVKSGETERWHFLTSFAGLLEWII